MPRRIAIKPHLSIEELRTRYRNSSEPTERSHYQIIWLLAEGKPTEQVAEMTGYSRNWIYELVWGYNRLGVKSLGDKRKQNRGAIAIIKRSATSIVVAGSSSTTSRRGIVDRNESCNLDEPTIRQKNCTTKRMGISQRIRICSAKTPTCSC